MRVFLLYLEVLLLACRVGLGWSQSCFCMEELNRETESNSTVLCPILERAQHCLNNAPTSCFSFIDQFQINQLRTDHNCAPISSPSLITSTTPSSTSSSSMPTPNPDCPEVSGSSIVELEAAVTVPLPISRECDLPDSITMEHCSAHTFSHVRPFKGSHSGIQTCSLPGAWYLLRHSSFSVEVEGEAVGADSLLTFLTKVNITFSPHLCSPQRVTYFADSSLPLPSTFEDDSTPRNTNSPLQLTVNGNVASILATWLNTTIVLRQYAGYLSVTVQVPGMLAFESEGLCTGCPAHTQNINISTEVVAYRQRCPEASNKATLRCYLDGGVVNVPEFAFVDNASYREMCIFDALRAESLQVLSLVNAIARDAVALPPIGTVPRQEPVGSSSFLPTRLPILDLNTEPPVSTTQATQRVSRPTDSPSISQSDGTTVPPTTIQEVVGASSAPSKSYLVNLLTVLVTVLIAALLR